MRRNTPEQDFQIAACQYLAANGLLGVAVPNEGERSAAAGGRMKAAGLTPGFLDLLVFDRRGPAARGLLCIGECKRPRKRSTRTASGWTKRIELRPDQVEMALELKARGAHAFGPWDCLEDIERDLASIGVTLTAKVR